MLRGFFAERILEILYSLKVSLPREIVSAARSDAQEFLGIDKPEFYKLARKWEKLGRELWKEAGNPLIFYEAWNGVYGKSNICANILDQFNFKRKCLFASLQKYIFRNCTLLDFGCGTGVLSFIFAREASRMYSLDIVNFPQEFLKWRCRKYSYDNVVVNVPGYLTEIPDSSVDVCVCIDVLEHLLEPSKIFGIIDAKLKKRGILLLRSPFGYYYAHPKEAKIDWINNQGMAILKNNYKRLGLFVYKKIS